MIKNKFKLRKRRKNKAERKPRYWILSATTVGVLVAFTVGSSRAVEVTFAKHDQIVATRKLSDGEVCGWCAGFILARFPVRSKKMTGRIL